jgi:hypothetical protein
MILQGKIPWRAAPKGGRKCSCRHDIMKQHHTTLSHMSGFRLGYCIVCKKVCNEVKKEFEKDEI